MSVIKIIRRDAVLLKADVNEPDYIFRYEDIKVNGWKITAW